MLRIGICDDENTMLSCMEQYVGEWVKKSGELAKIESFSSAEQLLFSCEDIGYDILLLDIQMAGMDGVSLAKKIREKDARVQIVFVTAIPDYIAEGYEVSVLHYLLKPVEKEKLFSVLDKAVRNLPLTEASILWQTEGEMLVIPLRAIRYLEAKGHYLTLYTDTGNYTKKASITAFSERLDERFFRCQRSFAVNLHRVKRVTRTEIELISGERIPLSRNLYDAIHQAIIRLYPEDIL